MAKAAEALSANGFGSGGPIAAEELRAETKLDRLREILVSLGSVLVAFSGGVDSSFLLKMALDTLGPKRVLAVTAASETYFPEEVEAARDLAQSLGARHLVITTTELEQEEFATNPPERCYFCKRHLMSELVALARAEGLAAVVDGSNWDDLGDYRPGARAARELGVRSPLQEAGLTKAEIRAFSRQLSLPTWDKPSLACLASRFPYWTRITREELRQVAQAEGFLRRLGFRQLRVRHHGSLARIEVLPEDFPRLLQVAEQVRDRFQELGYVYVTMDLAGYRTGSMNEILRKMGGPS